MAGRSSSNPGKWCECGNRKGWHSEACGRCIQLDGRTGPAGRVLSEMRVHDVVTVDQLIMETGLPRDAVRGALGYLGRRGRIRNLNAAEAWTEQGEYVLVW